MTDWADIEIEYSLGEKSVEELSREYDVSVVRIENQAICHGWSCEGIHALSFARQRFVEEYFVDFKAGAAALRAGISEVTGARYLRVPEVQKAIAARMREMRYRTGLNQDKIIGKMAAIAFGDIGDLYDENGVVKPLHELSEEQRAMIESIETIEGKAEGGNVLLQTKKLKVISKGAQLGYLERLGKYKGLFNDKVEIEATVEHKESTPNDVARRLAFILLKASRKAKQDQPTEDKEQTE
jgi:phage terminase small subunit